MMDFVDCVFQHLWNVVVLRPVAARTGWKDEARQALEMRERKDITRVRSTDPTTGSGAHNQERPKV